MREIRRLGSDRQVSGELHGNETMSPWGLCELLQNRVIDAIEQVAFS